MGFTLRAGAETPVRLNYTQHVLLVAMNATTCMSRVSMTARVVAPSSGRTRMSVAMPQRAAPAARLAARHSLTTATRPLVRARGVSAARAGAGRHACAPVRAVVDPDTAKTSTGQKVMIIGGDGCVPPPRSLSHATPVP